jgi:hypothetical protein
LESELEFQIEIGNLRFESKNDFGIPCRFGCCILKLDFGLGLEFETELRKTKLDSKVEFEIQFGLGFRIRIWIKFEFGIII